MTRSGIKRGLAVSAVSALSIVGLPAAAHAAPAFSISLSTASGSVQAFQTDAINGSVKDQAGTALGGETVTITLTETVADAAQTLTATDNPLVARDSSGSALADPADLDGDPATLDSATFTRNGSAAGTTTFSDAFVTTTASGADLGKYAAQVASKLAGTVNVKVSDGAATTASQNVTVTGKGASSTANDATKLTINSASAVSVYKGTTDPAIFKVTATDGTNGVFTGGAFAIAATSAPTVPVASGPWSGATPAVGSDPYATTVDLSSTVATLPAGDYVVEFWVNKSNGSVTTAGPDAGEPTAIGSLKVATAPAADTYDGGAAGSTPKYDDGVAYYGTATAFTGVNDDAHNYVPAGEDITVPLSFQVIDDSATATNGKDTFPAAGTKFVFDVTVNGKTKRLAGSYDAATGLVTGSASVAKADATGNVSVELWESQDATDTGKGHSVTGPVTVAKFQARSTSISQLPGAVSTVQATAGGAVSIPVVVTDQFGKVSAGDVLQYTVSTGASTTTPATDATGRTTISYTTSPATTAGTSETVTATDVTHPSVGSLPTVTVKYIAGTTAAAAINDGTTSLTAKPIDPYAAGGTKDAAGAWKTNLDVSADGNSNPYAFYVVNAKGEALSNTTVTLAATGGEVSYNGKTGASLTAVTDPNGLVTGVQIGSKKVGTVALTVTSGAASFSFNPIEVANAGAPYYMTATGPATIVAGQTGSFTVSVTDEFGNPLDASPAAGDYEFVDEYASIDGPGYGISPTFGTDQWPAIFNKTGQAKFIIGTLAGDAGKATVTVPVWTPGWASEDKAHATVAGYTDPSKGVNGYATVTFSYTVVAPPVVKPPATGGGDNGGTTPPPAKPATAKGASKGKKDVITVTGKPGTKVVVKAHGKKVGHAVIGANGKAVVKVKDSNGKKVTKYSVAIGAVKKALKLK